VPIEDKDSRPDPQPLHVGLPYELREDLVILCENQDVLDLSTVRLIGGEKDVLRRLVYCRNIIDGPDFDGGPDDKLGQAIGLLCEDIDERLAQRLTSRVSALLSERLGVAVEGETAEELIALVRDEIARWYEPTEEGEADASA